ncbi:MAG TPA: hypothetical protein VF544_09825 [Pyrinomonadaceae bacterium]|jgi:hypothetical protein
MRKLIPRAIPILALVCLVMLVPSTAKAQLSRFEGAWRNVDPATSGLTTLQISTSGTVKVHAWGKCHPTDCDWGEVTGYAYGPNVSANLSATARAISAVYTTGFSETIMIIRPLGRDQLEASVFTRFTDTSGRTAYTDTYRLARVKR